MTDAEWRDVCVEHCWLDIDLYILNAMREAYELGFSAGYLLGNEQSKGG